MNRLEPEVVRSRFKEVNVPVRAGTLGVREEGGLFVLSDPLIGCCGIGIMVVGKRVPVGFTACAAQRCINDTLGLSHGYAMGFFDGFAGWGPIVSTDDEDEDWQSEYLIGQADGELSWKMCDPLERAKLTLRKASRIISERGWTRGSIQNRGRVAIDGAIRMALWGHVGLPTSGIEDYEIALEVLENFLRKHHNKANITAPWWNDQMCMDAADACQTLLIASS